MAVRFTALLGNGVGNTFRRSASPAGFYGHMPANWFNAVSAI